MPPASPSLTIVVASTAERPRLVADLASSAPQCARADVELVVARADTPAGLVALAEAFPAVRFIGAPPTTDIPALRGLGFSAARGDVVTLLDHVDDQGVTHERWVQELRRRCTLHHARAAAPAPSGTGGATGAAGAASHPYLSVVVPVHQGASVLADCLAALSRSDLPRASWELIVVDDASTDESAGIAARFADVVVRLPGRPHGTAYARNRGFELARGECTAFINADVCVAPDALTQFADVFAREPQTSAVFGCVDPCPTSGGVISQYRALRLRYYEHENLCAPETFYAACGAVRSSVFASVGMFDEWHFQRHGAEDFELGHRLRQHGRRVVMWPEIRATHLKCWTLRGMITADLRDRTVPRMRLFDRRAFRRRDRSDRARTIKRVNTALTWLALALVLGGLSADRPSLLMAAGLSLAVVLRNYFPLHRFFVRHRGHAFALAVLPLELLSYLVSGVAVVFGWALRHLIGEPKPRPTVEAFAEIGVRTWPPVPAQRADPAPRSPSEVASEVTLERPA